MIVTATKTAYDAEKHHALFQRINPAVGVDLLIGQVQRDLITLFEVHADGLLLGVFLSRIERLIDGTQELVILHASAVVKPPMGLMSICNPLFDQVAKDHGLKSIRVHSDKKGIDQILNECNYVFQETVYRKEL